MATRAASFDEGVSHSFEEEWPEIARRLERLLAAKGVEVWLRADVVQETATRLYRRWARLDHSRPLWNLVVTIALRILIDEHRRTARVELVSDTPQSEVDDVEARALHRVHLTKTQEALKELRADQRRVLLAEIGQAATLDGPRNRINVLRLRARLALKSELGPWAPAGVALRMRSLRAAVERRVAEWGRDAHAVAASIASVAVAATLVLTGAGVDAISPGQQESLPNGLRLEEIRASGLYPAIASIERPAPPNLSEAKDQAKKKAPGIRLCAVVCTRPEGPVEDTLLEAARRTNDAVKEADNAIREGDRQLRKGEKKAWRDVNDALP